MNFTYSKQHFSTKIFRSYIVYLNKFFPHINPREVCENIGVEYEFLINENNWVSIEFNYLFMEQLRILTQDPNFEYKVGLFSATKDGLGSALYLLGRYGISLDYIYKNIWSLSSYLNKVTNLRLEKIDKNFVSVRLSINEQELNEDELDLLKKSLPGIIQNTVGYCSAFPSLKNLSPAKVDVIEDGHGIRLDILYPYDSKTILKKIIPASTAVLSFFIAEIIFKNELLSTGVAVGSYVFFEFISMWLKLKNLSMLMSQTEKNIQLIDSQYKQLFETKTVLQRKLDETKAISEITNKLILSSSENEILGLACRELTEILDYDRAIIFIKNNKNTYLEYKAGSMEDSDLSETLKNVKFEVNLNDTDQTKVSNVYRYKKPILISNVKKHLSKLNLESQALLTKANSNSFVCVPIYTENESFGILLADNFKSKKELDHSDVGLLSLVSRQIAIALEKNRAKEFIQNLASSYSRFVPFELINLLGFKSVTEIDLKSGREVDMAIVFCDIRGFTSMSEQMDPGDSISFLNSYFSNLAPILSLNNGIIDKFLGDGILALFTSPSDAVKAAEQYQIQLSKYNADRRSGNKRQLIAAGMGIHYGKVLLGAVGYAERLSISVVSDAVNLASRLDGLTKKLGVSAICTDAVIDSLSSEEKNNSRFIAELSVEGRASKTKVFELFAFESTEVKTLRKQAAVAIGKIINYIGEEQFEEAKDLVVETLKHYPEDPIVKYYYKMILAKFVTIEFSNSNVA